MDNVVSLVDVRNGRLRSQLLSHAKAGETVVIETRTGLISAEKILCRASFAEILNTFGDYFVVEYADIKSMRAVSTVQTSAVNGAGDWVTVAHDRMPRVTTSRIVPFRGRSRRPVRERA